MGEDCYHAKLVALQASCLAEEAHDVHLVHLVLLASAYVECLPPGRGHLIGIGDFHGDNAGEAVQLVEILLRPQDEVRRPCPIPPCRAAVAVDIGLAVHGQMIVYDVPDIGNVKPSGGEVGTYQHIGTTALETEQCPFPVLLLHGTMEGGYTETGFLKELVHAVHCLAVVQENHTGGAAQGAQQAAEGFELVLLGRAEQILADAVGIVGIGIGKVVHAVHLASTHKGGYLRTVRSRKQDALPHGGQHGHDVCHLLAETQFQGLVELVYNQSANALRFEIALLQMVQYASGGAYYQLWREAAHGTVLVHGWAASVAGVCLGVAAEPRGHTLCLDGQFTAGDQNEHGGVQPRLHCLQDRKHVAKRLAAARG